MIDEPRKDKPVSEGSQEKEPKVDLFPTVPGHEAEDASQGEAQEDKAAEKGPAEPPTVKVVRAKWKGSGRQENWPWQRRLWLALAVAPLAMAVGAYLTGWPTEVGLLEVSGAGLVAVLFGCLTLNSVRHPLRGDTALATLLTGTFLLGMPGTCFYLAGRHALAHPEALAMMDYFLSFGFLPFAAAATFILAAKFLRGVFEWNPARSLLRLLMIAAPVAAFFVGPIENRSEPFLDGLEKAANKEVDVPAVQRWLAEEAPGLMGRLPQTGHEQGPLGSFAPQGHRMLLVMEAWRHPSLEPLAHDDGDVTLGHNRDTGLFYTGRTHWLDGAHIWGIIVVPADTDVEEVLPREDPEGRLRWLQREPQAGLILFRCMPPGRGNGSTIR